VYWNEIKKLKPGDRVLTKWYYYSVRFPAELYTKGYVLKITKNYAFFKYPSHKKAPAIRVLHWRLTDWGRFDRDIIAETRKAVGEPNNWYNKKI